MKILIFLLLLTSICYSQNTDYIPRITKVQLNDAYKIYKTKGQEFNEIHNSLDIQTTLVDFIPKLVDKNRNYRYVWDHNEKNIYIYKHLIHFDSVQIYNDNVFKYVSDKNSYLDTNTILRNIDINSENYSYTPYTNISCLEKFTYKFVFVDNLLKADFAISTFKSSNSSHKKYIYVFHIPNLTETISYQIEAEMPWDIDCFKTKIILQNPFSIRYSMIDLENLNKIRKQR